MSRFGDKVIFWYTGFTFKTFISDVFNKYEHTQSDLGLHDLSRPVCL